MGCLCSQADTIDPILTQAQDDVQPESKSKYESRYVHEDNPEQDDLPLMQPKPGDLSPGTVSDSSAEEIDQELINTLLAECEEQSDGH